MNIKWLLIGVILIQLILSCGSDKVTPPDLYGPIPSERQLNWQELEMIGIIHFGLNTFTDREWGYGDVDPSLFNPSDFDADQIVATAKDAGLKGIILVAKHHDGFCLWPTETTEYNISHSPWKDRKGDMVKEFQESCEKHGLQFGIYCSPWDRNNATYGTDKYLALYRDQLRELYSNYGDLFESWHDGANGGDGYYGGANEIRKINRSTYYDWDSTWKITREMQQKAVIFSDSGWDVRWVGNEIGYAPDTSWQTFTPKGLEGTEPAPGNVETDESPIGTRNGKYWMPAELDVPIRPGWFWHENQNDKVKTPEELFDIYIHSVGRAGTLNLGLAPDTTGRFHENDVKYLKQFGKIIRGVFSKNLAKNASFKASNIRGSDERSYGPQLLLDNDRYSYWATDDTINQPKLEIKLSDKKRFNLIQLRENIQLGQRIDSVVISVKNDKDWRKISKVASIGANRIIRLPEYIETDEMQIQLFAPVSTALSEFGLYEEHL